MIAPHRRLGSSFSEGMENNGPSERPALTRSREKTFEGYLPVFLLILFVDDHQEWQFGCSHNRTSEHSGVVRVDRLRYVLLSSFRLGGERSRILLRYCMRLDDYVDYQAVLGWSMRPATVDHHWWRSDIDPNRRGRAVR